jgi:phage virion morphogenesis protein
MAKIQVRVESAKARDKVKNLNSLMLGLTYAFTELGEYILTETDMRFDRGVDPTGKPWLVSKRAMKDGGKTLVDHAILRQSVNYNATHDSVEVGVGNFPVYARIHQKGGRTGKGHRVLLPARPYLGITEDDKLEARNIILRFLRLKGAK